MKLFFSTLPRNFIGCFKGRMLLWHLAAIVLTLALVLSGFDWQYFLWTRSPMLHSWMFPAVHIGGRLPILLPLTLLVLGGIGRSASTRLVGWAIGQAEIIGGNCRCRLQGNYGPCSPSARHRHRNGPEPCFQVRPAARRCLLGLALLAHHHRFRNGGHRLQALPKAKVARLPGTYLRFLCRCWRFHDHPLVFGFRRGSDGWLGRGNGGWKEFWENIQRSTFTIRCPSDTRKRRVLNIGS